MSTTGWETAFFDAYSSNLNIAKAAKAAGVTRQAVYWRIANDAEFRRQYETLRSYMAAALVDKGIGLALEGTTDTTYKDGEITSEKIKEYPELIKFFLAKLEPDTFGDRPDDLGGTTIINMPMPSREEVRRRLESEYDGAG